MQQEYDDLFSSCVIRQDKMAEVETFVNKIAQNKARYEEIEQQSGVPWYFIAAIHCLEASLKFDAHLHNGDPLTARTVHVPKGRPPGNPPFTWKESALDALSFEGFDSWTDWSMPGGLYKLEGYNGFGYRPKNVNSPYLWSYSNHYTSGKYVKDGEWDPNAVSKQCGAAVLLRRMADRGIIAVDAAPQPTVTVSDLQPVPYAPTVISDEAKQLQKKLNTFPGILLVEDGRAGKNTSDAFKKLTGNYLPGDPRA